MSHIYYAITGIGWGRGETPQAALGAYLNTQLRNFPRLSVDDLLGEDSPWGFIWRSPQGTTGFYDSPSGMFWRVEGSDEGVPFDGATQKVGEVGAVPEQFRL